MIFIIFLIEPFGFLLHPLWFFCFLVIWVTVVSQEFIQAYDTIFVTINILREKNTLQVCSTFSLCDLGKEHIIVQIKLEDATRYPFFCIPFVDIVMENTGQCLSFDLVLYILVFSCFTLYIPVDRFIVIFDIYIG